VVSWLVGLFGSAGASPSRVVVSWLVWGVRFGGSLALPREDFAITDH